MQENLINKMENVKLGVNPYLNVVNHLVSRALSMQNRNPMSSTYGCFDRNFWHFKTIIDFPSSTYQQVVLGLSKLFTTRLAGNNYYQNSVIAESIRAGILYWCRIENRDGSFNEYYVNDRSFCPTAYTTYAISQAYSLIRDLFTADESLLIKEKLLKAAKWLSVHKNPAVFNQMIASMNALYWVARVTKDPLIHKAFEQRRREVLAAQDEEGWFSEYGGADTGYSFKALDLLSFYLEENQDSEILSAAARLVDFINNFLHPDGTSGGDYCSRSTQHVFPFGIEFLSSRNHQAAKVTLAWFREFFEQGKTIHPNNIDDKYALYFYFNSYVGAFLIYRSENCEIGHHFDTSRPESKLFENAGILRLQFDSISAWLSFRHNGTCRIFSNDALIYADGGYLIRFTNNQVCATQYEDKDAKLEYRKKDEGYDVEITGHAGWFDDSLPMTKWLIPFKLFCKTILYSNTLAYWFHTKLKSSKIAVQYRAPLKIRRAFLIRPDYITVRDALEIPSGPLKISEVKLIHDTTLVHSPSSRFYQTQYLFQKHIGPKLIEEGPTRCVYEYDIPTR